ncbi:hypothetical protein NSB25_16090 [Acetatifactor muris]|uniref:Uncharacterized protein n=1 Tax=Acetatifactor muris TaxID=879566 RepID=A0A2K4ZAU8_9FIRM|nr:DUF6756 family protein [Acetatifactor muris]MCR2048795.1 hypothetical protein [Acetatifactor muris]SOY27588.1 hypothetical protein AMURIS_00292 [Acetatifactor muris]
MNMKKSASDIFRLEHEMVMQCGISKERFHKVRGNQWENIYQKIVEKYADKTKIWKNGLHWANTNGYSPKSMKKFLGCYAVDYSTWFYFLPQIIKENNMVYFLINKGRDWNEGEEFWIFESYIPELVKVLDLLNHTAFLDYGWLDYYIVSKKYQWIIGFNHHDIISCIGEGLNFDCFENH